MSSECEKQREDEEVPSPALYQVELINLLITALMIGASLTIHSLVERHGNAPLVAIFLFGGVNLTALLVHSRFAYFRINYWVMPRCLALILLQIVAIIGASMLFSVVCPRVRHWKEDEIRYKALSLAEAQHIYQRVDHDGDGVREFAKSLRDLYETRSGAADLMLISEDEAELDLELAKRKNPHYLGYRIVPLVSQGSNALGGAASYMDDKGNITRCFAYLAYPLVYNKHGCHSFLITPNLQWYKRDLGPDTASIAAKISTFDPDTSWTPYNPLE